MNQTVDNLILDLLEWLLAKDRTYAETMDAWRTSCPRLTVWEDAVDRDYVSIEFGRGASRVKVSKAGIRALGAARPTRCVA